MVLITSLETTRLAACVLRDTSMHFAHAHHGDPRTLLGAQERRTRGLTTMFGYVNVSRAAARV